MRVDIPKLLDDLGISYATTGKHARPGWVNVECPFCTGNPGDHLGFNLAGGYCNCYRCGGHHLDKVLMKLTGQNRAQIKRLLDQYKGYGGEGDITVESSVAPLELKFPSGIGPLGPLHRQYLEGRGFDPDQLIDEWGLKGTGPFSLSETGADYKFRIIAPIHHQDQLVSYQARDVTDRSDLKYKACPMAEEVLHHKHLLYGLDKIDKDRVLVLEGIFDVWRVPGSVATFGIEFTREQVALLSWFDKVFVLYDPEPQAQEQAEKLAWQMFDAEVVSLDYGDPAEMDESDVLMLRKDLRIQ